MEPSSTPPLQSQLNPEPKPRLSKKMILIIGGVIVVLIAILLFATLGKKDDSKTKNDSSQSSSQSDLYHKREGYANLSTGIGDAQALYFKQVNENPFDYQGTKVIQACNVLSIDDVRASGLQTRAFQIIGNGTERNYFDGQGKGVLDASSYYSLPENTESNYCKYGVEKVGSVKVDVYQEPYSSVEALSAVVAKMTKRANPIGENNVYEKQTDDFKEYIIGKGSTAASLVFLNVPVDKHEAIVKKVSDNLSAQRANPKGAPKIVFESPLLKGKPYADACSLLTSGAVRKMFNAEASPLVKQVFANSVGVISYNQEGGKKLYDNYVTTECQREPIKTEADISTLNRKDVTLEAQTFLSEQGAKTDMVFLKQYNSKSSRSAQSAGADAFFTKEATGETLHVRQGRVVLRIHFADKTIKSIDQISQRLVELSKEPLDILRKQSF